MQPTSQQQLPFKLIQLDYQWLTHFFDTLLLLFEPMLSNPFCLKIISDDEGNQSTSNNPHEILSHMTVESPIFGLIKDKIESLQQGPFQNFSVYMLVIVSKIALSILKIEKNYCIGKSELFRILNFCETETLDFIKAKRLTLDIKSQEKFQVGDKEFSCKEFLNKNLPEVQEEIEDLADLLQYARNASSCDIIDIKRGTLYSENKKKFDIGYTFSFAKDHSNLDESQLKYDHQTTLNNGEILLLNIKQDGVSEIFHEKNHEILSQFRAIITTCTIQNYSRVLNFLAYVNDKIRDECTNRQTIIFSNIKYKNLKNIASLLNQDISSSLNFISKSNKIKTTIKVISSLQSFQKESFYLSSQDTHNPILSHNYYLVISPTEYHTVSEQENEFCQLIYYNYGSNDSMLKAKNYWMDGLLKRLLHILQTKKVIYSVNCFEKDLVGHYRKIVKEEKNIEFPNTWFEDNTKNQKFILKEFVQVLSEEFELIEKNTEHEKSSKIEDYAGKKYVLKESFKLVKLIFLHKYGVVI